MNDDWPEQADGWELARHDRVEAYRKRLANNVTVTATWDDSVGTGRVEAYVEPAGIGRTLSRSRKDFRDKEAFWTAAHSVLEMAANLPSLGQGQESPAELVLFGDVAGTVEAEPGSAGIPEAELTFTLTDGRSVALRLSDEQAFDLCRRIDRLDDHVWSAEREESADSFAETDAEVPDARGIQSSPDTGHDVVALLGTQFGVGEDHLLAHVDWSAVIVVGEPAVSSLIARGDELAAAVGPRWQPAVVDRPGERWVVLS
ncbi:MULTISPECIES: hypothetical protein [unclassified Amycolatopsis]|uniref:hypothetical protein n=1 Tax=unclassified Amycolatopsis TaxID=2618356 RepID=UPI00106EBB99|nr:MULTISPECIES: hypothetical protein [unclassified Amycolatopsis]MCG3751827.1 hypothetical protein [Amycolatopsis sp. Poz14]